MYTVKKYILEGEKVIEKKDFTQWIAWMGKSDRQVRNTFVEGVRISTVFLGLDHSLGGPRPVIFETMVFGGKYNESQERYCTFEKAVKGHEKWVTKVAKSEKK